MKRKNVLRRTTINPVPKQTRPNMVVRTYRVSEKLYARVIARCKKEEENVSDVIRRALEEYADGDGQA